MSQANPTSIEATLYAESYILDGCQTTAFIRAFPQSQAAQETIYVRASAMHKTRKVQVRIKELQAISKDLSEKGFGITASGLKETLARVITEGFKTKTDKDQNTVPVSLAAVVSAANEISKMDGNHAAQKIKVGGDVDNPLQVVTMSPEAYRRIRAEMLENTEF